MAKAVKNNEVVSNETPVFTKEQIISSKQFANRQDALAVIIEDDEELTIEEVKDRLNKFMSKEVK